MAIKNVNKILCNQNQKQIYQKRQIFSKIVYIANRIQVIQSLIKLFRVEIQTKNEVICACLLYLLHAGDRKIIINNKNFSIFIKTLVSQFYFNFW